MRIDPPGSLLTSALREPRIVVAIIYPTASIYVTNKAAGAIANVPGAVVEGCLEDVSSTTQEIVPEEGRSTIGTLSFSIVDVAGALTTQLRSQLSSNDLGVGRRLVRVYTGDTNDFTDGTWRQIDTYMVDSVVAYDRGSYKFSCSDLKRQLRERIFVKRSCRLVNDITDISTSIEVDKTSDFSLVEHTAAFSDAPSSTVGYGLIKKTGEVFRFTGTATGPIRFTGVTRGVFNTRAQAVDVDPAAAVDRQPEIQQVYYLEMPAPQMAYALMTGAVPDTAITLPDDYHLGIDTALVDLAMFQQIGTDLYDPASATAGLVLSFSTTRGLTETDGKRFIEEQLNVPMWAFNPVSADGKIGLRKLTRILADAAPSVLATTANVIDHGTLDHRVGDVINRIVVKWNHNGEDFTRTDELVNLGSISRHGLGQTRTFEFLGLTVQRHTVQTLQRIFNAISDRYSSPPQSLDLTLSSTLNQLEAGDVLRVTLPMRDFTDTDTLDRSFEVEQRQWNPRTGEFKVTGFASTTTEEDQPPGAVVPLLDAWYTGTGTALSSVLTIVANAVTANGNLTAGTYYHAGSLTINNGITVTVNGTVQLRIRGTLTINGKIDGKGRGESGLSDSNTNGTPYVATGSGGNVQTLGSTRGSAGIQFYAPNIWQENYGETRAGQPAIARPSLQVVSGALLGIPTVCYGTGGIFGGAVIETATTRALGGAGGASGAGLVIVTRATPVFGASGSIDLSGLAGGAANSATVGGVSLYSGGGGGGAPGELYVFLDGTDQILPDLNGKFLAGFGSTTQTGSPIHAAGAWNNPDPAPAAPWTGFEPGIGSLDVWQSASLVTWVPTEVQLGTSDDEIVPAPTTLAAAVDNVGVTWTWEPGPVDKSDYTELWIATTNDRTGALRASSRKSSSAYIASDTSVTRYGWVRNFKNGVGYSTWYPTSSTGGVSAVYGGASGGVVPWTPVLVNVSRSGNTFTKTDGAGYTAQVYSTEKFSACTVATGGPSTTNLGVFYGLNTDPTTDASYTSIDFCFAYQDNGHLAIYRNGSAVVDLGTYSANEATSIRYNGQMVLFYRGATLVYSEGISGQQFALDSSFHGAGVVLPNLTFSANIPAVTTGKKYLNSDPTTSTAGYWMNLSGGNWEIGTITDGKVGNTELRSNGSAGTAQVEELTAVPVDLTKAYKAHAWVRRKSGDRLVYLFIDFFDSSGASIANTWAGGSYHYWGLIGAGTGTLPADSVWREYTVTFGAGQANAIPSTAKTMKVGALLNYTGGTTDGVVAVQDFWIDVLTDLTNSTTGTLALSQQNIAARGWNNTTAFSVTDADTVAWAAGTFTSADGTSYSISGGNTGNMSARTYIYLDIGVSTTAFQTTTTATTAIGSGKVLIASAINGTTEARYQTYGGAGGLNIDAADIVAGTVTANEIAASLTWTNDLQLSSTGKIRKAKTSASDTTKGIWLGDDGASGDDFHVGDASTYLWFDYSAATLKFRGTLDYAASTFTPTWTGFGTAPTGDLNYINFGSYALLWSPGTRLATSNATTMSITNLPAGITPSSSGAFVVGAVYNNGNVEIAGVNIDNTGVIQFFPYVVSGSRIVLGAFTASGNKGLGSGWNVVYPLI